MSVVKPCTCEPCEADGFRADLEKRNAELVEALRSIREKCGPPWSCDYCNVMDEDMREAHEIATEAIGGL